MSHYSDIRDSEEEELINRTNINEKLLIQESLKHIQVFKQAAFTRGIEYELQSIEKFYKAKLYDLRHVGNEL